jgi:hypothetical protein
MAIVWKKSSHGGTDLLMLLAIADFADDDGRAYPAVGTLAKKCRMGPRNANYVLSTLRDSGELQILVNEGPHGTNLYQLRFSAMKGMQRIAGGDAKVCKGDATGCTLQPASDTPAKEFPKPLQPVADKPSVNHQEPSKQVRAKKRAPSSKVSLDEFIDTLKARGEKPVSDYAALWRYCEKVGLPRNLVEIAWNAFRAKYGGDGEDAQKRYADWRSVFLKAVKGNWHKVWFLDSATGEYRLTTVGEQARRAAA